MIIFAKLQNTLDQPRTVRQMANADPRFPNYSTANQLLNDQQFVFLLVAGYHAGQIAAGRLEEGTSTTQSPSTPADVSSGLT